MVSLWTINVVLALASSGVLVVLLGLYARNYRQVATAFGLSLMIFAAVLLAQNLFAVYSNLSLQAQGFKADVALPMLILQTLQLVAVGVLLKVSWD